jgi:hypothetical protein
MSTTHTTKITATATIITVSSGYFETETDALDALPAFPKYSKVSVRPCYGADWKGARWAWGVTLDLRGNGVTGERNESGIKRYRAVIKACKAAGHDFEFTTNIVGALTSLDEIEAAIA